MRWKAKLHICFQLSYVIFMPSRQCLKKLHFVLINSVLLNLIYMCLDLILFLFQITGVSLPNLVTVHIYIYIYAH